MKLLCRLISGHNRPNDIREAHTAQSVSCQIFPMNAMAATANEMRAGEAAMNHAVVESLLPSNLSTIRRPGDRSCILGAAEASFISTTFSLPYKVVAISKYNFFGSDPLNCIITYLELEIVRNRMGLPSK